MSTDGFEAFETTVQKSHEWLHQIKASLGECDPHLAYGALREVLHGLRDRLPVEQAVALGAQLPMLIRGLYYEGWRPSGKPAKTTKAEFLASIQKHFGSSTLSKLEAEGLARVVLQVLAQHVTGGEVEDIKGVLPKELRELWPSGRARPESSRPSAR